MAESGHAASCTALSQHGSHLIDNTSAVPTAAKRLQEVHQCSSPAGVSTSVPW